MIPEPLTGAEAHDDDILYEAWCRLCDLRLRAHDLRLRDVDPDAVRAEYHAHRTPYRAAHSRPPGPCSPPSSALPSRPDPTGRPLHP